MRPINVIDELIDERAETGTCRHQRTSFLTRLACSDPWLPGVLWRCTLCGTIFVDTLEIRRKNVEAALEIIVKPDRLIAEDVVFLRRTMELSVGESSKILAVDKSTISRWEKHGPSETGDRLIRLAFLAALYLADSSVVERGGATAALVHHAAAIRPQLIAGAIPGIDRVRLITVSSEDGEEQSVGSRRGIRAKTWPHPPTTELDPEKQ